MKSKRISSNSSIREQQQTDLLRPITLPEDESGNPSTRNHAIASKEHRHVVESIKKFDDYLRYARLDKLKQYTSLPQFLDDNFQSCIDDEEMKQQLKNILNRLKIPEEQHIKYLNAKLTLRAFFLKLVKQKNNYHIQLTNILEEIDRPARSRKVRFLAIAAIAALAIGAILVGLLFAVPPLQSLLMTIIDFALSSGQPILGLAYTGLMGLSRIALSAAEEKASYVSRARNVFFLFMNLIPSVIAYGFWIAKSTLTMTPLVAGLLVASALVDVIKEVVCGIHDYINYKTQMKHQDGKRNSLSLKIGFEKHARAALINLVAALLLVGVIAAWNFVPGGIFVTVGAVALMAVIYTAKFVLLKYNEKIMHKRLEHDLSKIGDEKHQKANEIQLDNQLNKEKKPLPPTLDNLHFATPKSPKSASAILPPEQSSSATESEKSNDVVPRQGNSSVTIPVDTQKTYYNSSLSFFGSPHEKHTSSNEDSDLKKEVYSPGCN